jgi:hypothetical protein
MTNSDSKTPAQRGRPLSTLCFFPSCIIFGICTDGQMTEGRAIRKRLTSARVLFLYLRECRVRPCIREWGSFKQYTKQILNKPTRYTREIFCLLSGPSFQCQLELACHLPEHMLMRMHDSQSATCDDLSTLRLRC